MNQNTRVETVMNIINAINNVVQLGSKPIKSNIMIKTGSNTTTLKPILNKLVTKGLIETRDVKIYSRKRADAYYLTEKGKELLKDWNGFRQRLGFDSIK